MKTKSRDLMLGLTAAWVVAVPQPVLDVLAQAPEYWSANRIDATTVVLLTLVFTLLPPVLLSGVFAGLFYGLRGRVASSLFFSVAFTALISLALYRGVSLGFGKPIVLVPLSLFAACTVTWIYWRFVAIRLFFSIYSVMALVTPVSFLLFSPTRALFSGSDATAVGVESRVKLAAPLVVVVLDELSLASLIHPDGEIEARLFPNFHRLSEISTWFQNATTNYGTTERAIPSLVTGRLQNAEAAETSYRQNSRSLFTLVEAPDGVFASEPVTHLCPPELCGELPKSLPQAFRQLSADFSLIFQNVFVPDRYASRIRPIPQRFRNLAAVELSTQSTGPTNTNVSEIAKALSDWFRDDRRESLVFLHLNVPHAPYLLNPDGTAYSKLGSYDMLGWSQKGYLWSSRTPFYAVQGFQRYLLQAMYTDEVLGSILNVLEEKDLLKESTLVVTADHGVAFTPGEKRRAWELEPAVAAENNAIPLFWKSAGQTTGATNTRNVELIDVLPTLLDELGDSPANGMDGQSVWSATEREEKVFSGSSYSKDIWPDVLAASSQRYRDVVIIENADGSFFPQPAKYSSLIGMTTAGATLTDLGVELNDPNIFDLFNELPEESAFKPNFIEGHLTGTDQNVDAVGTVLNGFLADVVDLFEDDDGIRKFSSVINPSALELKTNELGFVGVQILPSGEISLRLLNRGTRGFFVEDGILKNAAGEAMVRDQRRLIAAYDILGCSNSEMLHIKGWLGDRDSWRSAQAYLVLYQGEQQLSRPSLFRPGLAQQTEGLAYSGFDTYLRLLGKTCRSDDLRMFVIFDEKTYAEMENILGMQPQEPAAKRLNDSSPVAPHLPYRLTRLGELLNADGALLPSTGHQVFTGGARVFKVSDEAMRVAGWAAGGTNATPARTLLLFAGERPIAELEPNAERPDVAEAVGESKRFSGFDLVLSSSAFDLEGEKKLRVLALFDDGTYAALSVESKVSSK